MTGRELVAPPCGQWFSERELAAAGASLPRYSSQVPETSGRGREAPLRTVALPKSVAIPLSRRS